MNITKSTTMLDLLKAGAKIEFPGGYYMKGDTDYGYIDVGTELCGEGSWDLTEDGLENALNDLSKMAHDSGYTLDGKELADEETE